MSTAKPLPQGKALARMPRVQKKQAPKQSSGVKTTRLVRAPRPQAPAIKKANQPRAPRRQLAQRAFPDIPGQMP